MSRARSTDGGFRAWLAAATVSTTGDSVTFFALGWVAAGMGPAAASLVLTAGSVPLCLFILVGGSLADRYGVRGVMVGCDVAMAAVMALLAVGAVFGTPLWLLVAAEALAGTAAALRRPAEGVMPRLFCDGDELARRMALVGGCMQVARVAGPGLGGVLVAAGGLTLTSTLDAVTFAAVAVVLLAVRPPHEDTHVRTPAGSGWRSIVDGVRAARRTPGVPGMLLAVTGVAATVLPLVMLCLPLLGRDRGWSAGSVGLLSGAWVVGGLLVTAVVARVGAPGRRLAVAGTLLGAPASLVLVLSHDYPAALAAMVAVGVGTSLFTTHLLPAFVAATPPDMLARFQSLAGLAQTGPVLVAMPLLGWLAAGLGTAAAVVAVAVVLAASAVPVARMRATPDDRVPVVTG